MKRYVISLLVALFVFEPALVSAQSHGYGQALGSRRQVNRRMMNKDAAQSFNRNNGMAHSRGSSGDMMMESGGSGGFSSASMYQVHLLGQVENPGTYRLPPSTRMDEAIIVAGGVKQRGSKRRVEIRRAGKKQAYDLHRYRLQGKLSQNPFLLDNDVIFVPFSLSTVAIQGPVKNSGSFELSPADKTAWDLLRLAGGYTAGASFEDTVKVIRFENGAKQLLSVDNNKQSLKGFKLLHGDIVIVPHILTKDREFDYNVSQLPEDNIFYPSFNDNIFVLGAVSLPGAYPFSTNYQIRDFVSMAGPIKYAKLNSVYIMTSKGERIRKRKSVQAHLLSPGDTIVVPEKSWTSDNVIKWYNTVANSIITGFTLRELIRRN